VEAYIVRFYYIPSVYLSHDDPVRRVAEEIATSEVELELSELAGAGAYALNPFSIAPDDVMEVLGAGAGELVGDDETATFIGAVAGRALAVLAATQLSRLGLIIRHAGKLKPTPALKLALDGVAPDPPEKALRFSTRVFVPGAGTIVPPGNYIAEIDPEIPGTAIAETPYPITIPGAVSGRYVPSLILAPLRFQEPVKVIAHLLPNT